MDENSKDLIGEGEGKGDHYLQSTDHNPEDV